MANSELPSPEEDALYERAVRLSEGPAEDAERAVEASVAAFRRLHGPVGSVQTKRKLAKALWRQSIIRALRSQQPAQALAIGAEGVALAKEVLARTPPGDPEFEDIVRDVSHQLSDAGQIAGLAGLPAQRRQWLLEARDIARRGNGPGATHALGTSLHNLTEHALSELNQQARRQEASPALLRHALELVQDAVDIRRRQHALLDPNSSLELANSLLLSATLSFLGSDAQRALAHLDEADMIVAAVPKGGAKLRQEIMDARPFLGKSREGFGRRAETPCPCGSGAPFSACHGVPENPGGTGRPSPSVKTMSEGGEGAAVEKVIDQIFLWSRVVTEPIQNSIVAEERREIPWLGLAFEALSFHLVLATRIAMQSHGFTTAQLVANAMGRALIPQMKARFFSRNPPEIQEEIVDGFLRTHYARETEYGACEHFLSNSSDPDSALSRFVQILLEAAGLEHDASRARLAILHRVMVNFMDTDIMNRLILVVNEACRALANDAQSSLQ